MSTVLSRAHWIALAAVTLIWGLNWPIMKFSLRELSPLYFRALTMSGGTLLLVAYFGWRGTTLRLPRSEMPLVLRLALPNIVAWHLFSILGVQALASGRAAILGFTMPIWTVLLGALLYGARLTRRVLLGTVLAALAIGLLIGNEFSSLAGRPLGVAWMQVAAIGWALGTIGIQRAQTTLNTEALTVWMMALGSLVFWLLAACFEPWPSWRFSAPMWIALAWGTAVNYGVAQIFWFGLVRALPATASAFSIMTVPLIGIFSAALIVGEVPHALDLVAAACIIAALAVVLLSGSVVATSKAQDR